MIVSLGVIAYNEEKNLPNIFSDLLKQNYPHDKIEVVLVDSASTDTTRQLMNDFAAREKNNFRAVTVLSNPKKTQPCGWNVFITGSVGELLIKWDAHARFPKNFIAASVHCIEGGEDICGGRRPCIVAQETPYKHTLLLAENSLFGSSIAPYRRSPGKEYVKSVFHGAYKREALEKVDGFDERLCRTEDNDIHYRLRQEGYKICFDENIISAQLMRASFPAMLKQKYSNGKWIGLTTAVSPLCLELYHFVPFCFLLGIIISTLLCFFGIWQLAVVMWALYGALDIAMTVMAIVKNKKFHPTQLLLVFMFLLLHISYGVGTLVGFCKIPFWKERRQ